MIIAGLANQKGGVGKTTTSVNLASGLALNGHRVLLVDMDPQHNASSLVGVQDEGECHYIGEALVEHKGVTIPMEEIIQKTALEGLYVAPGAVELSGDSESLDREVYSERRLRDVLEPLDYDFVIIDSPPNLGRLTINVIYAADILLVPVVSGLLSVNAWHNLSKLIRTIKGGLSPSQVRIFYTLYKPGAHVINQWADGDLEESREFVMESRIRDLTALVQAQVAGQSIFEYAPKSKGAGDYEKFIEEFLACQKQILEN